MSSSRSAIATFVVASLLGASACGKDDPKPSADPSSSSSASARPTDDDATPTEGPSATSTTTSPAVGLPEDFPAQKDVPMVPGVVTGKTGGEGPDGRKGWVIELSSVGSQNGCFDRAAAALVAAGFTKQGEIKAGDTRQAQFTSDRYAVIVSARADGANCQLGYEIGQVGH
jgi:hypothetical protein